MPLSLKTMLKKFAHKGQITQEEYDALIKKLDGHDKKIRNKAFEEFAKALLINEVVDKSVVRRVAEQMKGGADNGE